MKGGVQSQQSSGKSSQTASVSGAGTAHGMELAHACEQSWERGLATSTLAFDAAPAWDGEGIPAAVHLWKGEGGLRALTVIAGEADEPLRIRTPAGRSRLSRPVGETVDFDR